MVDGILNVYKEQGFTSHDVVAKLRGILKMKKIGHTGTLDPQAQGVLPVCLGRATKLCGLLAEKDKAYRAVLLLGTVTDTQDTAGTVLSQRPVEITEERLREIIQGFTGEISQVPPMYSAVKMNGKKLYELAREGKEIERPARKIRIDGIHIEEFTLPRVTMEVSCSKGTYIRTLCHDIGEQAGCGGCMEALERIRSGVFRKEGSLTLREIEGLVKKDALEGHIVPLEDFFADLDGIVLKEDLDKAAHNGNYLPLPAVAGRLEKAAPHKGINYGLPPGTMGAQGNPAVFGDTQARFRIYDSGHRFIGVYAVDGKRKLLKPWKMFL